MPNMNKRPLDDDETLHEREQLTKKPKIDGREVAEDTLNASPKHTKIDADGDLILRIGDGLGAEGQAQTFQVCSAALRRSSQVFKSMLNAFGPRKGPKPTNQQEEGSDVEWTVNLPEDDPHAFSILLNILHGHVDQVPADIDLRKLEKVLAIADKYFLTRMTKPWIETWSKCLMAASPYHMDRITILGLARKLNNRTAFLTQIRDLTLDSIESSEDFPGDLLWVVRERDGKDADADADAETELESLSELLDDIGFVPAPLVETMAKHRRDMVGELRRFWERELDDRNETQFHCALSAGFIKDRCTSSLRRSARDLQEIESCDSWFKKGLSCMIMGLFNSNRADEDEDDDGDEEMGWWAPGLLMERLDENLGRLYRCERRHFDCFSLAREDYLALQKRIKTDIERFADVWEVSRHNGERVV